MSYREIPAADVPELHPVAGFSQFWADARGADAVPLRANIEPTKIPAILPWILLLEAIEVDEIVQFRYRLTGSGCREIFGIDFTGKLLGEDLTPEGADIRRREFISVMTTGKPIYSQTEIPIAGREFINVYRGVFPVSRLGKCIDQIFIVIAHEALRLVTASPIARTRRPQAHLSSL